ncbi:ABC transporter ATP-binding protein [Ideonella sp. BN130291]|uniref:ABC transporter ATP-binding protein n=1 Tax=Ideonella sp. BN130291 TaxID=3112940 RepID=UPI002E264719|nr:ABC transporter ATP-binding protein [Ideonella sp. BN130291]
MRRMLRLTDLHKHYDGRPVFSHVSLDAAPGEVVALLGDSGVGKSTLLNGIAGLDRLDRGEVMLGGTAVHRLDEPALALWRRHQVGFVFQAFHVLPHLDVAHNVALPLLLQRRPDAARVQQVLDAVGLGDLGKRAPRTLSGGQLQRVAIARALVHRPALVLADEPTGNLDPDTAARVLDVLLQQVRSEGTICLLVTHSPVAAARADRVLRLNRDGLAPAR